MPVAEAVRARLGARVPLVLATLGLLAVCAAWAVATPIFAVPDEPAHVTRAAAIVDGQVIAPDRPLSKEGWPVIRAPNSLAQSIYRARCLWSGFGRPNVPATCVQPLPPFRRLVDVKNAAGRYEPLYYAVVGWPLRWAPSAHGVYAARAVNVILCTLLLVVALAASGLGRRGRAWWRLGLLTACTPFVFYIAMGVNTSSWEICAAAATWAGVLRLCADGVARRLLVAATTVAAAVLAITRPLGPLWLGLIALTAVAATPWSRLRALLRSRALRAGVAVIVASCAASVWWTATETNASFDTSPLRNPLPFGSAFTQSFGLLPRRLEELVAVFGWNDVPVPWLTLAVWVALAAILVVGALWRGRGRARWTLLALAGLTILVPALVEAHMATRIGLVWQGRYTLPLAIGVPLLAGHALNARGAAAKAPSWLLPAAAVLAGAGQVAGFVWALRRYEHGVPGSLDPFTGAWLPPGGPVLSIALFVAGIAALYTGLVLTRGEPVAQRAPAMPSWAGAGSNRRPSAFQADARTD